MAHPAIRAREAYRTGKALAVTSAVPSRPDHDDRKSDNSPLPSDQPSELAVGPDALAASEVIAGRGPASVVETGPICGPSLFHGFRALRHRDFRLFYVGQLVSLIGTWMQSLAQSWLILILTHSAFALGLVGALQFLPVLFLSAFGGLIADRAPKRNLLLGTQSAQMLLAFALAGLTAVGKETFAIVLMLALLLGIANAVDMPTRQAFVVEMVGPNDLINAIALNSTLFNAARLIGPALAGLLIGIVGIAGCFFLNGASFLAVIFGLLLIHQPAFEPRHFESVREVWQDLQEGFQYVRRSTSVRAVILITGFVGTFAANFNVVTPILAQNVLYVGATGLGWLMAAMGFGSLIASLGIAYFANTPHPRAVAASAVVFSVLDMLLAPIHSYAAALAILALIGASMVILSSMANSYLQLTVPHRLRGRVMSLYTTVFVGTTPIGNTLTGLLAETTQAFGPLFYGGLISLLATIWLSTPLWRRIRHGRIRSEGDQYRSPP